MVCKRWVQGIKILFSWISPVDAILSFLRTKTQRDRDLGITSTVHGVRLIMVSFKGLNIAKEPPVGVHGFGSPGFAEEFVIHTFCGYRRHHASRPRLVTTSDLEKLCEEDRIGGCFIAVHQQ